ncbi:hypothetical protein, partial [Hymenobacter glacieicola]|uniref:hypothetical protein n=1 Tax=Hymenobacter glacieicola TaxID=1562124 RepID=UPI001E35FE1F
QGRQSLVQPLRLSCTPFMNPLYISNLNLDKTDVPELVRQIARRPQLPRPRFIVDCATQQCLRKLGISHFISQLLLLHNAGGRVVLRNVSPVLQRCLALLKLDKLFHYSSV